MTDLFENANFGGKSNFSFREQTEDWYPFPLSLSWSNSTEEFYERVLFGFVKD